MNKNRKLALAMGIAAIAMIAVAVLAPRPAGEVQQADGTWELVVEVEARSPDGVVLATRQARATICEPDAGGNCLIAWDWEGESLPTVAHEWVKPYFLDDGYTVPLAFVPDWCPVPSQFCQSELTCDGETIVAGPSGECLAALAETCGLEPDERGFWYGGMIHNNKGYFAFVEPLETLGEWWESCPVPPPTATPYIQPTYTPNPTYTPLTEPTCLPTWTPEPPPTALPTHTPYPPSTSYPDQPSWE